VNAVGSLPRKQLISDVQICRRYREGESLALLAQRSGLWTSELKALLARNGQDLRTVADINQLKGRNRRLGTLRLKPAKMQGFDGATG
jgi:hypothetical protein